MDASDFAAGVVAVTSAFAVLVLLYAVVQLTKTLRVLAESIDELRHETLPAVTELRGNVQQASAELERVDALLGTAESISATVDSASKLAYLAFSNPVIKSIAFATGTGRAAKRFRKVRGLSG